MLKRKPDDSIPIKKKDTRAIYTAKVCNIQLVAPPRAHLEGGSLLNILRQPYELWKTVRILAFMLTNHHLHIKRTSADVPLAASYIIRGAIVLMTEIRTISCAFTSNMWYPVKPVLSRNDTGFLLNLQARGIAFVCHFASVHFFPFVRYFNFFCSFFLIRYAVSCKRSQSSRQWPDSYFANLVCIFVYSQLIMSFENLWICSTDSNHWLTS